MSQVILNIGAPESGKTTRAIKMAEKYLEESLIRGIWANDRRKEHKYRVNKNIQCWHGSADRWHNIVFNSIGKAFCHFFICDEAGDYFLKSVGKAIVKEPQRAKRFNGNVYLLNFHDLVEVPDYVWRFADYIMVGYTSGDNLKKLQAQLLGKDHIIQAWINAQNNDDYFYYELLKIHTKSRVRQGF